MNMVAIYEHINVGNGHASHQDVHLQANFKMEYKARHGKPSEVKKVG